MDGGFVVCLITVLFVEPLEGENGPVKPAAVHFARAALDGEALQGRDEAARRRWVGVGAGVAVGVGVGPGGAGLASATASGTVSQPASAPGSA